MMLTRTRTVLVALAMLAAPVAAYHRTTPPIVQLTTSGEHSLPRVQAGGRRLVLALEAGGHQIFRQDRVHNVFEQITTSGDNMNPTVSANGDILAWDVDCDGVIGCADSGQQVFRWASGTVQQITHDPTGTSSNPALSGTGARLAFESLGDLASTGNAGVRQIFRIDKTGLATQISHGAADSRNPALDKGGLSVVFESSNDQGGNDTGVAQVWLSTIHGTSRLTAGAGPSRHPAISSDGRVLAFESQADLLGDGHDTGVNQVFAYDLRNALLSQITNDLAGCGGASVQRIPKDWSIGYVCHGEGLFRHLVAKQTFRIPVDGGDTQQSLTELGAHFMVISTTANLFGGGTTPEHQIYMLNLFKLPAVPVS
jgi:Tol biopolymer transport system component